MASKVVAFSVWQSLSPPKPACAGREALALASQRRNWPLPVDHALDRLGVVRPAPLVEEDGGERGRRDKPPEGSPESLSGPELGLSHRPKWRAVGAEVVDPPPRGIGVGLDLLAGSLAKGFGVVCQVREPPGDTGHGALVSNWNKKQDQNGRTLVAKPEMPGKDTEMYPL
jgi:hypothetical protein